LNSLISTAVFVNHSQELCHIKQGATIR